MKPVDIAIVVHNPVRSDARVRKQAKTLEQNGFDIALFGYGAPHEHAQCLDDLPLLLVDKIPIAYPLDLPQWLILKPERYARRKIEIFPVLLGIFVNLIFTLLALGIPVFVLASNILNIDAISNANLWIVVLLSSLTLALILERSHSFLLFWVQTILAALAYAWTGLVQVQIPLNVYIFAAAFLLLGAGLSLVWYCKKSIFTILKTAKANYKTRIGYELLARKLARAIGRMSPRVIHAHDIIALIAAVKVKKVHPQTIIIWDAHELYTELAYKTANESAYIDRIIRDSTPHISYFITINDSIASIYHERYPDLPKAVILMNATNQTDQETIISSKLNDAAAIDEEQRILLFQGGFTPGRGIGIMLKAAVNLPKDWTMFFMGNGPLELDIEKAGAVLNQHRPKNKPAIALIPSAPYEELVYWTAGADLGIIPYENTSLNHLYCTPNKLWEYPNAGVPILASGLVEMDRFITTHDIGICMPINFTAHDMIRSLLSYDLKMQKHFNQQCIEFNKTESWAIYAKLLLQIYRGIGK